MRAQQSGLGADVQAHALAHEAERVVFANPREAVVQGFLQQ